MVYLREAVFRLKAAKGPGPVIKVRGTPGELVFPNLEPKYRASLHRAHLEPYLEPGAQVYLPGANLEPYLEPYLELGG